MIGLVLTAVVAWCFLTFSLTRAIGLRRWRAIVVVVLMTLGVVAAVAATLASRVVGSNRFRVPLMVGSAGLVVIMYLGLGLIVVGAVNLAWWLVTRRSSAPVGARAAPVPSRNSRRLPVIRSLTVLVLALAVMVTGYGFVRAQEVTVTRTTLAFDTLPANFDGFTIAL
ncbi:MAG: hypothetical protein LBI33_13950, partial [Propionibacteriaceae bacterium]|nr:hypothetical protein [Propionibacteriaceae bacterium]